MNTQYIHDLTFGAQDCTFKVYTAPAGDPAALALPVVNCSREVLKQALRVCSLTIPQKITGEGVFLHPDVHSAVSNWLIDV